MRRLLLLLFFAQALLAQSSVPSRPVVLTHVAVIDVASASALPDRTIVITGNRISAVNGAGKQSLPKKARIFDASGKYVIPGLWDMHVHWGDRNYFPLFLANGVTGIRIMWGSSVHQRFRKEIAEGKLLGPRMFIGSRLIDGPVVMWPGSVSVHTTEEARLAVDDAKSRGAEFVKVYSFLPREMYFAIVDECKKQSIPFAGHVPLTVSVEEASDAGQKSIEHLLGVLPACSSREQDFRQAAQADFADMLASGHVAFEGPHLQQLREELISSYDPAKASELFARFKKNGTWICPTLTLLHMLAYRDQPSFTNDPRLKYMSSSFRAMWASAASEGGVNGNSPADYAFSKREFHKDLEVVAAMNHAGVDIIAGTDVSNPYCFPGFSLPDELELYVKAGLSPAEALRTATINPARFLGRENELGSVAAGKLADLVLLDANPLDDINNVRKISALVYDGHYYDRDDLDAILAKSEALASRKSIADLLWKTIAVGGIDAAVKQYHELKTAEPGTYNFDESELNNLGYKLLGSKKLPDALRIFQLNVESYPDSGDAYDSLAEGYMVNGDKQQAIANYRKSLQLDPSNQNAVHMLQKLNAP